MLRLAASRSAKHILRAYRLIATRRRRCLLALNILIFISPADSRSGWGNFSDGADPVAWRLGAGLFF
jgi:hypothetical protein